LKWSAVAGLAVCSPLAVAASFFGRPVEFFLALLLLCFAIAVSLENRRPMSAIRTA
jgi:hypothetical protein